MGTHSVTFSKTGQVGSYGSSTRYVVVNTTETFNHSTGKYDVTISSVQFKDNTRSLGSCAFFGRLYINNVLVFDWEGTDGNVQVTKNVYGTVGHKSSYGTVAVDNGGTVSIKILSATSAFTSGGMGAKYQGYLFSAGTGTKSFTLAYVQSGSVHIDDGASFDTYDIYIDNGVSFEKYVPYIDNGVSWELYS